MTIPTEVIRKPTKIAANQKTLTALQSQMFNRASRAVRAATLRVATLRAATLRAVHTKAQLNPRTRTTLPSLLLQTQQVPARQAITAAAAVALMTATAKWTDQKIRHTRAMIRIETAGNKRMEHYINPIDNLLHSKVSLIDLSLF